MSNSSSALLIKCVAGLVRGCGANWGEVCSRMGEGGFTHCRVTVSLCKVFVYVLVEVRKVASHSLGIPEAPGPVALSILEI